LEQGLKIPRPPDELAKIACPLRVIGRKEAELGQ